MFLEDETLKAPPPVVGGGALSVRFMSLFFEFLYYDGGIVAAETEGV